MAKSAERGYLGVNGREGLARGGAETATPIPATIGAAMRSLGLAPRSGEARFCQKCRHDRATPIATGLLTHLCSCIEMQW
mgnify:FL=1